MTLVGIDGVVLKSLLSSRDEVFSEQYFFSCLRSDTVKALHHLVYLRVTKLKTGSLLSLRNFSLTAFLELARRHYVC